MSSISELLVHPQTGVKEQTWEGFSWPCLFFGVFWFLYKSMWIWALVSLILAIFTSGLSWFVMPFFANGLHSKGLIKAGWLTSAAAKETMVSPETHVRCPECRELVRSDARKCKHCGTSLVPQIGADMPGKA
jgi:hypothetical protein